MTRLDVELYRYYVNYIIQGVLLGVLWSKINVDWLVGYSHAELPGNCQLSETDLLGTTILTRR